jgi:RalA-binding protein 1
LRTFEKKHDTMQKSLDTEAIEETIDFTLRRPDDDDQTRNVLTHDASEEKEKEKSQVHETNIHNVPSVVETVPSMQQEQATEKIAVGDNGLLMLPKDHPDYVALIRLQLENQVSHRIY